MHRLLTYGFLQVGFTHLLLNLLFLAYAGWNPGEPNHLNNPSDPNFAKPEDAIHFSSNGWNDYYGDRPDNNNGYFIEYEASSAQLSVTGTGGATDGNSNYGVHVIRGTVTSAGGNIHIYGTGGGTENSASDNVGVRVVTDSIVQAEGDGSISINASAGLGHGIGFYMGEQAEIRTPGSGNVVIVGIGSDGVSKGGNQGAVVAGGSLIEAQGTGQVHLQGVGGHGGVDSNAGVVLAHADSRVTTNGGPISIHGTGGGSGEGGVLITKLTLEGL